MIGQTTPTTDQVIQGFGLPAAIVIIGLVIALIFTVRLLLKEYSNRDTIQEKRITDAKELGTRIIEPLEKISDMSQKSKETNEKIYELLLSGKRRN